LSSSTNLQKKTTNFVSLTSPEWFSGTSCLLENTKLSLISKDIFGVIEFNNNQKEKNKQTSVEGFLMVNVDWGS
jgi:hypothetical protein